MQLRGRNTIDAEGYNFAVSRRRGITVVEVLVVAGIISLLMSILLPAMFKIRASARALEGMNNQRQIVLAVNCYAVDNDDSYPSSVATIGISGLFWHWQEPTRLIGINALSPQSSRAMSEYLGSYIKKAGTMFCPNAPVKYKYLQQAWDAGDEWDNPDTIPLRDPMSGTYCLWWNYVGWLGPEQRFVGAQISSGGGGQSQLLVSCYFGYGHWRSPEAFGSCEDFQGADVTQETYVSSAYWSCEGDADSNLPDIKLHGGYMDGHVESFSSFDTVPMRVSKTADGSEPYPDGIGPGIFYLPRSGLR